MYALKQPFYASLIIFYVAVIVLATVSGERIGNRFQSRADENRDILEQYRNMKQQPGTVLVGSSLSRTLPFGKSLSDHECEYNLALSGGSARTGLVLLSRSKSLPRQVLIEVNVIDRSLDNGLLSDVSGIRMHFKYLQARYNPINMALSWIPVGTRASLDTAVNPKLFRDSVDFHVKAGDQELDQHTAASSIEFLRRHLNILKEHGSEIKFVELPVHSAVANTRKAQYIRQLMRESFPEVPYIWVGDNQKPHLAQTTDGIHLRADSAELVTTFLKQLSRDFACAATAQGN